MIRRRPTLLLLLFLLLLPARSPAEGGLGRMRELVRAAEELRAAGRTAEALSRYQEAHAASPSPRLFWPMAELDEQLGRPREGLEALEQY